jgi:hypothetical protein
LKQITSGSQYLRTLFLQALSFDGFDGGAGNCYQAKREVKSFWYPTWLAQPAALVPNSRVLDAAADELTVAATSFFVSRVMWRGNEFDVDAHGVMHRST